MKYLPRKSLRDIIGNILKVNRCSRPQQNSWIEIKRLWLYRSAFQGGLSFSLGDIIIPHEKHGMIDEANMFR
jgi:DNA-directed RNA polymerase subunit beta'